MIRTLVLLLVAAPGLFAQDAKPAGDYVFKARAHLVGPKGLSAALSTPDSAVLPSRFDRGSRRVLEAALPATSRRVAAEGRGDLHKVLTLSDLRKKDYVSHVALSFEEEVVKGAPEIEELRWGLAAKLKPVAVYADGTLAVDVEIKLELPFPGDFVTEFGVKVELTRLCTFDFESRVRIPLGGAVAFGACAPGTSAELAAVVIEVDSERKLEDLVKEQVDPPPVEEPRAFTAAIALRSAAKLREAMGLKPEQPVTPEAASRARGVAEFLSFGSSTGDRPLRVHVNWRESYVQERRSEFVRGRTLWLISTFSEDAMVRWSSATAGRSVYFHGDFEWLRGFKPGPAGKGVKDVQVPDFFNAGCMEQPDLAADEREKRSLVGFKTKDKDAPAAGVFAMRR